MGNSSRLVDWRGRPVNTKKHGGVRASIFIHALVLLSNAANIATIMNLVSYLRGTMHMEVAEASTTASNFFAALQMFSIPAAFLADSYIKRFYTVLIFGPIEILVPNPPERPAEGEATDGRFLEEREMTVVSVGISSQGEKDRATSSDNPWSDPIYTRDGQHMVDICHPYVEGVCLEQPS